MYRCVLSQHVQVCLCLATTKEAPQARTVLRRGGDVQAGQRKLGLSLGKHDCLHTKKRKGRRKAAYPKTGGGLHPGGGSLSCCTYLISLCLAHCHLLHHLHVSPCCLLSPLHYGATWATSRCYQLFRWPNVSPHHSLPVQSAHESLMAWCSKPAVCLFAANPKASWLSQRSSWICYDTQVTKDVKNFDFFLSTYMLQLLDM